MSEERMNYRYWSVSFNTPVGIGAAYYRTEQGQHLHHPESLEAWQKAVSKALERTAVGTTVPYRDITPITVQELEKEVAMARWPKDFMDIAPKDTAAQPASRLSKTCRLCDGARVCVDGNCMDDTPHPCHRCHGRG